MAAGLPAWALDPGLRCYDSGDRGALLPSGALLLLGRADSTVKLRGFKVALAEVESALAAHPAVGAAAVVAEQADGARRLVAGVVLRVDAGAHRAPPFQLHSILCAPP